MQLSATWNNELCIHTRRRSPAPSDVMEATSLRCARWCNRMVEQLHAYFSTFHVQRLLLLSDHLCRSKLTFALILKAFVSPCFNCVTVPTVWRHFNCVNLSRYILEFIFMFSKSPCQDHRDLKGTDGQTRLFQVNEHQNVFQIPLFSSPSSLCSQRSSFHPHMNKRKQATVAVWTWKKSPYVTFHESRMRVGGDIINQQQFQFSIFALGSESFKTHFKGGLECRLQLFKCFKGILKELNLSERNWCFINCI